MAPLVLCATAVLTAIIQKCRISVDGFAPSDTLSSKQRYARDVRVFVSKSVWGVGDDWTSLSSDHPSNAINDASAIFNTDMARVAAKSMEYSETKKPLSEEDEFVHDTVDFILHNFGSDDGPTSLYDTGTDQHTDTLNFLENAGKEIGLLVRCNERPQNLLVKEGRALPPLDEEDRFDPAQLVTSVSNEYIPTSFLTGAVSKMFQEHAVLVPRKESQGKLMDAGSVARWMTKSVGEEGQIGRHNKLVLSLISKYGTYGCGALTEEEFLRVYLDAVISGIKEKAFPWQQQQRQQQQQQQQRNNKRNLKHVATLKTVWRDLANHGMSPPIVEERQRLQAEIDAEFGISEENDDTTRVAKFDTLMDECEILEWGDYDQSNPRSNNAEESRAKSHGSMGSNKRSSFELVDLASDSKTPKRIRDGEFVFIDEESCIGCNQCANIAPSTFQMLDSGRARTFSQSNSPEVPIAVSACPVNCMHHLSFGELKEMETARDVGDGRTDHRHMGGSRGHTPLNVSRTGSDANHKSSWYHYLKNKCYTSKSCPQRGCFDCPMYTDPGGNPFFKKNHKDAESARAFDLVASGEADRFRKVTEL